MAVVMPPGQPPFHVRRVDGQWKVDLASSRFGQQLIRFTPTMSALSKAADLTAQELKDGQYETSEDAQRALEGRIRQIMQAHAASLQPATQPGSTTSSAR
jgi:hypothetical protein